MDIGPYSDNMNNGNDANDGEEDNNYNDHNDDNNRNDNTTLYIINHISNNFHDGNLKKRLYSFDFLSP